MKTHSSLASSGIAVPPLRVKFVIWLASRDKLQTRANLLRKGIVSDDTYQICSSGPEMASHILLHCFPVRDFWYTVGIQINEDLNCFNLHRLPQPRNLLLAASSPSMCSVVGTCERGATTTSSDKSAPYYNSLCVYRRSPPVCFFFEIF